VEAGLVCSVLIFLKVKRQDLKVFAFCSDATAGAEAANQRRPAKGDLPDGIPEGGEEGAANRSLCRQHTATIYQCYLFSAI
jgi:hypothetical protein